MVAQSTQSNRRHALDSVSSNRLDSSVFGLLGSVRMPSNSNDLYEQQDMMSSHFLIKLQFVRLKNRLNKKYIYIYINISTVFAMSEVLQRGLSLTFLLTRRRVRPKREAAHFLPALVHFTNTLLTVASEMERYFDIKHRLSPPSY